MHTDARYGILTIDTENPQSAVMSGRWSTDTLDITLDGHPAGVTGIMDACEMFGVRATFFVNVYESVRFPSVPTVVETILRRGHDVQLHTHPAWMFDPQRRQMWQYSLDEQQEILGVGSELLVKWTGKPPLAHRAATWGANPDTMSALKKAGILLDSSFLPGRPNCQIPGAVNRVSEYDGIVEIPIIGFEYQVDYRFAGLAFYRRRQPFKPLSLDGCSEAQLLWFLGAMESHRLPIVLLSMHSYSLVKWDSRFRRALWNPVDHSKLIAFLRESTEVYKVQWVTFPAFQQVYLQNKGHFQTSGSVPFRVEDRNVRRACVNRLRQSTARVRSPN